MNKQSGFYSVSRIYCSKKSSGLQKIVLASSILLTIILCVTVVSACSGFQKTTFAENAAKQIISNTLRSPSSAVWQEVTCLENNEKGQYVVYVEVDAQNALGVYIRGRYFVIVYDLDLTNQTFRYNSMFSYIECSGKNDSTRLNLIKGLNHYNDAITDNKEDQSPDNKEDNPSQNDNLLTVVFISDGRQVDTEKVEVGGTIDNPPTVTKENYNFLGWYIDSTSVQFPLTVNSAVTLTAKWEGKDCTYSLEGVDEVYSIKFDEKQKITIPANRDGYNFVGWYYGNVQISDQYGEMLNNWNYPTQIELSPKYELVQYNIRYSTGVNGTINDAHIADFTCDIYNNFSAPEVTAVPNKGYKFVKWSDGQTSPTRHDTNVEGDLELTAEFVRYWKFTFVADEGGTIEGNAEQVVLEGQEPISVTAIATNGYEFLRWEYAQYGTTRYVWTPTLNVSTVDWEMFYDVEYTAVFKEIIHTVTYRTSVSGGSANGVLEYRDPYSSNEIKRKSLVSFDFSVNSPFLSPEITIIPEQGYKFVGWSDGQTSPTRRDVDVNEDMELTAVLVRYWKFTFVAEENGTIAGDAVQEVIKDDDLTLVTAIADNGYEFLRWEYAKYGTTHYVWTPTLNVSTVDWEMFYEVEYTAVFTKINYTVTYKISGGYSCGLFQSSNSATFASPAEFKCNIDNNFSAPEVTAVPNKGYKFVKWSDGQTSPTRHDTNVSGDEVITAEFIKYCKITFIAESGGTIEGNAVQEINAGGVTTPVNAVADDGYEFFCWQYTVYGSTYYVWTPSLTVAADDWETSYEVEYTAVFRKITE